MQLPRKTGLSRIEVLFARKFLEAMEERVNDDDIGVQTVDSGRNDKIEPKSVDPAIPRAADGIQKKPGEELQEMGAGNGRNFMPDDRAGFLLVSNTWLIEGKIFNALGIEMNLAMLFAREAFQQFGEGALRAMPAVNER
jgi:hypothetical protein